MKARNVGIVLAGTANLASSALSPLSINVVHAETRDQIDKMNRDAQSVVERFHKDGGGTALAQKVSEAKQVPHLKVTQDATKTIHSSVQSIHYYDSSARRKIQKQISNLQEAENKQKQYNADYQKALQARNKVLEENKDAQAKLESLKQERTKLEQKLAEAEKNGVKPIHDQDTKKQVTVAQASKESQASKADYQNQSKQLDTVIQEAKSENLKTSLENGQAQVKANEANKLNEKLAQTAQQASKGEGVTVVEDKSQDKQSTNATVDQDIQEQKQDIQNQINNINEQIEQWNKTYADKKAEYEKALANYRSALKFNPKGLTSDQVNQGLNLGQESNAKLTIEIPDNLKQYYDGDKSLVNMPHQDINGLVMKITYSNLQNSYYKDSNGVKHKLTKLVRTLSNAKAQAVPEGTKDPMRILVDSNDPRVGLNADLVYSLDIQDAYFDENDNHVAMGNNAYYVPSSQNTEYINDDNTSFVKTSATPATRQFYKGLNGSKALEFAGSSVSVHDNGVAYSDVTNDPVWQLRNFQLDHEQGNDPSTSTDATAWSDFCKEYGLSIPDSGWDDPYNPYMFWGAGLLTPDKDGNFNFTQGMEVSPKTMSLGTDGHLTFKHNAMNREWWLSFITSIPDTHSPKVPNLELHWHVTNIIPQPNQPAIKEVHYHFNDLDLKENEVPDMPVLKQAEVHFHNVDLVLDPHPLPDKTKQITITDTSKKTKEGTQTYHFVDKNTGKVVTTSKVGGEVGKNVSVFLKVPAGYRLVVGQKIPTSANIKDKDTPINILVEKDNNKKPATQTYEFVDKNGNKIVGTAKVNGNVGDKVPVSLKVPKGYHLVPGQKLPTLADLKATDKPIKIMVEKDGNGADNGSADSGLNGKNKNTPNKGKNVNGGNGVASLPQTGNSKSTAGVLAGTALVATMASLEIAYNKKKRNA